MILILMDKWSFVSSYNLECFTFGEIYLKQLIILKVAYARKIYTKIWCNMILCSQHETNSNQDANA